MPGVLIWLAAVVGLVMLGMLPPRIPTWLRIVFFACAALACAVAGWGEWPYVRRW
jgi:TRAP-type C4-dicarboxylate transport system permease small subunit